MYVLTSPHCAMHTLTTTLIATVTECDLRAVQPWRSRKEHSFHSTPQLRLNRCPLPGDRTIHGDKGVRDVIRLDTRISVS